MATENRLATVVSFGGEGEKEKGNVLQHLFQLCTGFTPSRHQHDGLGSPALATSSPRVIGGECREGSALSHRVLLLSG